MATTQYIGPRIIPVFAPDVEWDIDSTYDALTMVQHQGETFMSRQFVPVGIQLPDSSQDEEYNDYWVHMSNWNAQVESYRQEVLLYNGRISTLEEDLPISDFSNENTVKSAIDTVDSKITSLVFDDVADMKASATLKNGMFARTCGFSSANDGGAAWYIITSSGTANEMDIIACGDLFAVLVVPDIVTPEMLGVDTSADCSNVLNRLFEIGEGKTIAFKAGETYTASNVVMHSNTVLNGNGATLDYGTAHGLVIPYTEKNIEIFDLKFDGDYDYVSNYAVAVGNHSNTARYESENVNIHDCKFLGGSVFGIVANNAKQVRICNCSFGEFVFVPGDSAGGYAVLLQSSINVEIDNCDFVAGEKSRHDIYVSTMQTKTQNRNCENVYVRNCTFDHSGIVTQPGTSYFYSTNTTAVMVRPTKNFVIDNCIEYNGTALVTITENETDTLGTVAEIKNCTSVNPVYNEGASEARSVVNCSSFAGRERTYLSVDNLVIQQDVSNAIFDLSVANNVVLYYKNSRINYQTMLNCDYAFIENIIISASGRFNRSRTDAPLMGKIKSVVSTGTEHYLIDQTGVVTTAFYDADFFSGYKIYYENGSWRNDYKAEPRVNINHSFDSGVHTITIPSCTNKPHSASVLNFLSAGYFVEVNFTDGDLLANQFHIRKYDASGNLVTDPSNCGILLSIIP